MCQAGLMWERWKEKKQEEQAARWIDSVTVAMSAMLEELKNRGRDRSPWIKSMYVVVKTRQQLEDTRTT